MILFQNASDRDIIDFYKEIRKKLSDKDYRIIYLLTEDIAFQAQTGIGAYDL